MTRATCAICTCEFRAVTLAEKVCAKCLADAKLGRLVRRMLADPSDLCLKSGRDGFYVLDLEMWEDSAEYRGDTPEEALEKAMGEER